MNQIFKDLVESGIKFRNTPILDYDFAHVRDSFDNILKRCNEFIAKTSAHAEDTDERNTSASRPMILPNESTLLKLDTPRGIKVTRRRTLICGAKSKTDETEIFIDDSEFDIEYQ